MPKHVWKSPYSLLILIAAFPTFTSFSQAEESAAQKTSFRFEFGCEKKADAVIVSATDVYSKERGYGFEPGATISDRNFVTRGYCTAEKPFYFSVAVPEGNYRITVTLGGAEETDVTVKAELRRLMLENVLTKPGQFEKRSFTVNIRTPIIAGGGAVRLKAPRETTDEAWAWDDRLTLEFNGKNPSLAGLTIEKVEAPTVFLLGDSTVCDQSKEPYASWGQMLPRFFSQDVAVANHGESGETVRSATSAHRFDKVIDDMKPGDYVFIQFGHNDMKSKDTKALQTYKETLVNWVKKIKEKKGTPVLVTPMNRHSFDGDKVVNTLGDYPKTVIAVSDVEQVQLIDLNAMSKTLYEALGPKGSIQAFKHDSGENPKFDPTHHSPYGAYELAKCVALGIKRSDLELAEYLSEEISAFDPSKPDSVNDFAVPPSPIFTNQRPLGD